MFCYQCGKSEVLIEGLCAECYIKQYHILTISTDISVRICAHCNAKFIEGKWIDANISHEEIIYRTIEDSIEINPSSENPIIDMNIIQMRGTIAESTVEATDTVFGKEVQEKHDVNVRLNKDVCPVCSKRNSNYYEAVIQIRSQLKKIENKKKEEIDNFINKTLDKLYKKDKLAYISQKNEIKEGVDYYIGSLKSARKLSSAIQERFGGVITESARLVTKNRDTGKEIYRFWLAIRLPSFFIGDFIEFEDKIAKLLNFDGKKISAIDLDNNTIINISWKKSGNIKTLKSSEDIEKTVVISKSPNLLQILDPKTYDVVDFPITPDIEKYSIDDEVNTITINDKLYII
jgi:nonsense-mediated mRNA decay protein 3